MDTQNKLQPFPWDMVQNREDHEFVVVVDAVTIRHVVGSFVMCFALLLEFEKQLAKDMSNVGWTRDEQGVIHATILKTGTRITARVQTVVKL